MELSDLLNIAKETRLSFRNKLELIITPTSCWWSSTTMDIYAIPPQLQIVFRGDDRVQKAIDTFEKYYRHVKQDVSSPTKLLEGF